MNRLMIHYLKMTITAIVTGIILGLSFNAFADTATFSFTPPTERTDNSPLLPAEIGGYNVFLNNAPVDTINPLLPTATGFTLDLQSGVHTVTVTTVDTDGRESLMSVPADAIVPFVPKAPASLNVVITITVN